MKKLKIVLIDIIVEPKRDIAKMKDLAAADANGDFMVDLKSEYNFGHAYYAAAFDKSGKTDYFNTITQAFIDGRMIITEAAGENLTDSERSDLKALAAVIGENWEKVIAEAVFKYAGSVYKDINALKSEMDSGADTSKTFAKYGKHWGELKGFALALQTGKRNLGETAVRLNRLTGFGPVLMNASQVTGMDPDGHYTKDEAMSWGEFQMHMLKIQKLMVKEFKVVAQVNDQLENISSLADKLGDSNSAEND